MKSPLKKTPLHALVVATIAAPLLIAGPAPTAAAAPTECADLSVSVARLTNERTGATLLTQFASEIKSAASYGFELEDSSAMIVSPSAGADRAGVWRVYNSSTNDFSWAAEGTDLQAIQAKGYQAQFRQFYGATKASQCAAPVYRLTSGSTTQLAVGDAERATLVKAGWSAQPTPVFYAGAGTSQPAAPAPTPTPTPAPDEQSDPFTVAIIPDTQQETWTDADKRFRDRSTWLVDNASRLNLKFVTHIGDVVDWGNAAPAQYTRAQDALAPLKGKVPYSLTIGNHDTAAVCQGGSACPGVSTSVAVRDTAVFNAAFPLSSFSNIRGQYEAGKVDNTYSTFTAGGEKWMVLNLELWPRQGAIDWAKKVVAAHADHNVIVSTHSYLNPDGTISTSNGGYGATSPKHLFDSLIKVYPNIKVVVSGHAGGAASRVDTGDHGNKILSLLQCFHSRTTNPVRLITFNVADGAIATSVYAPHTKETIAAETTLTGFEFDR